MGGTHNRLSKSNRLAIFLVTLVLLVSLFSPMGETVLSSEEGTNPESYDLSGSREENEKRVEDIEGGITSENMSYREIVWNHTYHDDEVRDVDVSDVVVYSGSDDNTVVAVDSEDKELLWQHDHHEDSVLSIYEGDGVVYSGCTDNTVRAVDAEDGEMIWSHSHHTSWVRSIYVSEGVVYSGSSDDTVVAADSESGVMKWQHSHHSGRVRSVYESDGVVYSGSDDETLIAYDHEDEEVIWEHEHHDDTIRSVYVSDGMVYSASSDDTVIAADAESGVMKWQHEHHEGDVHSVHVSDGIVYSSSEDETIIAACAESGDFLWQQLHIDDLDDFLIYSLSVSDGFVYSGDNRGNVIKFERLPPPVETHQPENIGHGSVTLKGEVTDMEGSESVDAYFRWRETHSEDWSETQYQNIEEIGEFTEEVTGLDAVTKYEFKAVMEWGDGEAAIADAETFITERDPEEEIVWTHQYHDDEVEGVDYSDGVVYSGSDDNTVVAVDTESKELLWRHDHHDDSVLTVYEWDGMVFSGSTGNVVRAVDAEDGEMIWSHSHHTSWVRSIYVSDGVVYSGSSDDTVVAVDAESGVMKWQHSHHSGRVRSVHESEGIVYSGSDDETVIAYDHEDEEVLWEHEHHDNWIRSVCVSDGMVYSGSSDDTVVAADAETGVMKVQHEHHEGDVQSVYVSDGIVYSSSEDETIIAACAERGDFLWQQQHIDDLDEYLIHSLSVSDGFVYSGDNRGNVIKFERLSPPVETRQPENIGDESVTLKGEVTDMKGAESVDAYFRWRETHSEDWSETQYQNIEEIGEFTEEVTGLNTVTKYEFKAVMEWGDGEAAIADAETFITERDPEEEIVWTHQYHDDEVEGVDYSDGVIYSCSDDGTVAAVDTENKELLWQHDHHGVRLRSVYEWDGMVYSGSTGNVVRAVDAEDGEMIWSHSHHDGWVRSIYVSDRVVYSGSSDDTVVAADSESGVMKWQHSHHSGRVRSVYESDGVVYSGSDDDTVIAYDHEDEEVIWRHEHHDDTIRSVYVSDGTVYSGSDDNTVIAADAETGVMEWQHEHHEGDVQSVQVSDGIVYSSSEDETIIAADAETGDFLWQQLHIDDLDEYLIHSLSVSDGFVYSGDNRGNVIKFERLLLPVETRQPENIGHESVTLKGEVTDMEGSESVDAYFRWRETHSEDWSETQYQNIEEIGEFTEEVTGLDTVTKYEFKAVIEWDDGETAVADAETFITDRDPADEIVWNHEYHDEVVRDVHALGEVVYSGSWDDTVLAVDVENKELLWQHDYHGDSVYSVYESGGVVYSGSGDETVLAYDHEGEGLIWQHEHHSSTVDSVHVSDGVVYSGSWDNTVLAANAETGEILWKHEKHGGSVYWVYESGGVVYSGSSDGTVLAYDIEDEEVVWQHEHHDDRVRSVYVSDGVVYSGSQDNTVIATDAQTGVMKWQHEHHEERVNFVHESNGIIYSSSEDETIIAANAKNGDFLWQQQHIDEYGEDYNIHSLSVLEGFVYSGDNRGNVIKFEKLPPPEFEFSNMSVEPDQVYVEEEVELKVDVENTGQETIEHNLLFHSDGEFIGSTSISLDSDESKTATITYIPKTSGTFEAEVADLTEEFTVYDYPDTETGNAFDLTYHSATLEGELLEVGMEDEINVFFRYKKEREDEWSETSEKTIEEERFEEEIENLESDTVYEFKAVGQWEGGEEEVRGNLKAFTTVSYPKVETVEATNLGQESATLGAELIEIGLEDSVEVSFRYREEDTGGWTQTGSQEMVELGGFEETIEDLESNTEYEFKAVVEWTESEEYEYDKNEYTASSQIFTTLKAPPDFEFGELEINPEEAYMNEEITISQEIKNLGDETGERNVEFYADDKLIDDDTVVVEGGKTETVSVVYSEKTPDTYSISVNTTEEKKEIEIKEAIEIVSASIDERKIERGETITIEAEIINHANVENEVELTIDDEVVHTFVVEPGTDIYEYEHEFDELGTYQIDLYGEPISEEEITIQRGILYRTLRSYWWLITIIFLLFLFVSAKKLRERRIEKEKNQLRDSIRNKSETIDGLVERIDENLEEAKDLDIDVNEFEIEFDELKNNYEGIEKDKVGLEGLKKAENDIGSIIYGLEELNSDIETSIDKEKDRRERFEQVKEKIQNKKRIFDSMLEDVESNLASARDLSIQVSKFEDGKDNIQNRYENIQYNSNDLNSLEKAQKEYGDIIDDLNTLNSDLESSIEKKKEENREIREFREKLNKPREKIESIFKDIDSTLSEIDHELQECVSNLQNLKDKYDNLSVDENNKYSLMSAVGKYKEMKGNLEDIQDSIRKVKDVEDRMSELLEEEENLDTREIESVLDEGRVNEAEELLSELEKNYQEFKDTLEELNNLDERLSNLSMKLADGEISRKDFRDAKSGIERKKANLEEKLDNLQKEVIYEDYEKPF